LCSFGRTFALLTVTLQGSKYTILWPTHLTAFTVAISVEISHREPARMRSGGRGVDAMQPRPLSNKPRRSHDEQWFPGF
jgi:hypothetical protein